MLNNYCVPINRSSVEVRVSRSSKPPLCRSIGFDTNNNKGRVLGLVHNSRGVSNGKVVISVMYLDLPPISTFFSVLMIVLYLFREFISITDEEQVCVSWQTVVTEGEIWRLLYAQFFHFARVVIFFNVITLMSIGRYLEKKIQKTALVVLILLMSVISNLLYLFFSDILCSGPAAEYTVGFGLTMFSLRMIHIFTMDPDANNGKGEPNLIFGFLPVHLHPILSPWQPLMETIFFEVAIFGRCVASNISGICAGLLFPYLMKHFRHLIMLPRNLPPPPPSTRSRSRGTLPARDPSDSGRLDQNNTGQVDDFGDDD